MLKKLKNTDNMFVVSLFCAVFMISIYILKFQYLTDESFYATVPYRLAIGDSLMQHEWHLSQFSALFSYLPVRSWTALKGSADGMIIYLRFVYLFIHTVATVIIYRFFRKKYEKWAITAAMLFFTQVSYRIFAINYNSMFVFLH